MQNKNKKSFSLIEIMLVVAVIGILTTIVIFGVSSARKKAAAAKTKADLEQLSKAFEMAANDGCRSILIESSTFDPWTFPVPGSKLGSVYCGAGNYPSKLIIDITSAATDYTLAFDDDNYAIIGGAIQFHAGNKESSNFVVDISKGYVFFADFKNNEKFICSDGNRNFLMIHSARSGCYCTTEGGCNEAW